MIAFVAHSMWWRRTEVRIGGSRLAGELGSSGSVLVAARQAEGDPFVLEGVVSSWEIRERNEALQSYG